VDIWKLALVSVSGGMLGPVLMLIGLRRLPGVEAALLLNLEAPLTILLSLWWFGEHLGRQAALGSLCILLGGGLLQWQGLGDSRNPVGLACLVGACACWALDNNLTQRLSLKDPFAIVRAKAFTAGLVNTGLGLLTLDGVRLQGTHVALALLLGSVSYGLSVVLDAYALRLLGAAREAAYFATAPFVGALLSVWLLDEQLQLRAAGAGSLMAVGVICLLYERHAHTHTHEPLAHDHVHVHDAHHQHGHPADVLLHEPHAHLHEHATLEHAHPHVSDEHHRHKHEQR
jgi:drug/metabolite transporter (DMT)-like permease